MRIKFVSKSGSGRPFVILTEKDKPLDYRANLVQAAEAKCEVFLFGLDKISSSNFEEACAELGQSLAASGIRHACLAASGAAASVVLAAEAFGRIAARSLILIDPCLRASAEGGSLPSFLHRVTCPVLLLQSNAAVDEILRDRDLIESRLPSVITAQFSSEAQLFETVKKFLDVPARCPQRGLQDRK